MKREWKGRAGTTGIEWRSESGQTVAGSLINDHYKWLLITAKLDLKASIKFAIQMKNDHTVINSKPQRGRKQPDRIGSEPQFRMQLEWHLVETKWLGFPLDNFSETAIQRSLLSLSLSLPMANPFIWTSEVQMNHNYRIIMTDYAAQRGPHCSTAFNSVQRFD